MLLIKQIKINAYAIVIVQYYDDGGVGGGQESTGNLY